ncbi:hypothetical protein V1639_09045 [Pseudarthrobacter sp. J75]|uniref:hypothetical protein n=1 Tax=unclassified Pseudarthrobacter TaxID=2647000 RepID=UPI002E7FC573|nr:MULTISPECIES: hypothetical protein [unclassified Pseudarthrobacter]MEE2522495.1 hypothetical protein [Pseudarthrobacter sp. J47]MEE2529174.1 hypothetical protein [Pseudarthrobacter sp. J75]
MGNSGKIAVGAALAAACLVVLTIFTLNEPVLFTLAGALALTYIASVWSLFTRGRYLAVVLGAVGSSLALAFAIAFLRMWGLAFNKDPSALGQAVTSRDSDIYFYLAVVAGLLTLAFLFVAAVWPARSIRRPRRPAPRKPASRKPAAKRPASGKPGKTPARKPAAKKPAARSGAAKKPAPRKPSPSPTR